MANAADKARLDALRPGFDREMQRQADWMQLEKERAAAARGGLGRFTDGLRNVGARAEPARDAVTNAASTPIKGIKGIISSVIPEFGSDKGYYGIYIWLVALVYYFSWGFGFSAVVLPSHIMLAVVGFLISIKAEGLSWPTFRLYALCFIELLLIDFVLLTGTVQWSLLLAAALLLAISTADPVQDSKRVFFVMSISSAFYYLYPRLSGLFLPFFAHLSLPINFDSFVFYSLIVANRTITFPFFWHAIFTLNKKTRVANTMTWFVMILLIFANWHFFEPQVSKIRSATGATPEQKAVIPNLWKSAVTNFRGVVASIGRILTGKIDATIIEAQDKFGFGEAKKEPKIGLDLLKDPNMPQVFDYAAYNHPAPTPSVVMSVTNPIPSEINNGVINVVDIACLDSSMKSSSQALISPKTEPTMDAPLNMIYGYGAKTVKCQFSGLTGGGHKAEIKVSYYLSSNADFSTAFMSADEVRQLVAANKNPADVRNIPPAKAEYNNGPAAIKWGPVELVSTPIELETGTDFSSDLMVLVSKSPQWGSNENNVVTEISGITDLMLTVPQGITLKTKDTGCMFEKWEGDKDNVYHVKKEIIFVDPKAASGDKACNSNDIANLRPVGEVIAFSCPMNVDSTVLGGSDWAGVQFNAHMDYIFSTTKTVSFEVKGKLPKPTTGVCSERVRDCTTQQLCPGTQTCDKGVWSDGCSDDQGDCCPASTDDLNTERAADACKTAGGTWKDSSCDCGAGQWDPVEAKCGESILSTSPKTATT